MKLNKIMAACVVVGLFGVWLAEYIMSMTGVNVSVVNVLTVIRQIAQLLVLLIVIYDAWGFSGGIFYRIIFIIITAALVFFAINSFF